MDVINGVTESVNKDMEMFKGIVGIKDMDVKIVDVNQRWTNTKKWWPILYKIHKPELRWKEMDCDPLVIWN